MFKEGKSDTDELFEDIHHDLIEQPHYNTIILEPWPNDDTSNPLGNKPVKSIDELDSDDAKWFVRVRQTREVSNE